MKKYALLLLFFFTLLSGGCHRSSHLLETAKQVDLQKYSGRWYEIAATPNHFQKDCRCSTADYTFINNELKIQNYCIRSSSNKFTQVQGKGWSTSPSNSHLKIRFFWPFHHQYWILAIAPDYQWALVGTPSRHYLWIIARETTMSDSTYKKIVAIAKERGFRVDQLRKTSQRNCESIPPTP